MAKELGKTRKRALRPAMGWREWVSLPGLGIERVKAKVDTGARTSSLHAYDITTRRTASGIWLRFVVHPIQRETRTEVACRARLVEERHVRSSNGRSELRPVIRTRIRVGEEEWEIDLTLTSRDVMGFRMLLGREAIRRRYVVDPGRSFLAGERPRRSRSPRARSKE